MELENELTYLGKLLKNLTFVQVSTDNLYVKIIVGILQTGLKSSAGRTNEYTPTTNVFSGVHNQTSHHTEPRTLTSPRRKNKFKAGNNHYSVLNTEDSNRIGGGTFGNMGVLGGVMGTVNKLLQWNASSTGYSWDPRKGLSYYSSGTDESRDPSLSISQPWEVLDGASGGSSDDSADASTTSASEGYTMDPSQSINLHYSVNSTPDVSNTSSPKIRSSGSDDDSFKRLLESMSRLSTAPVLYQLLRC